MAEDYTYLSAIWLSEKTASVLKEIKRNNKFGLLEDAVIWLIEKYDQKWRKREFTWQFCNCYEPGFWFGDRVKIKINNSVGVIHGMEFRSSEMCDRSGWYYAVRINGRNCLEAFHQSNLVNLYQ